MNHLWWWQLCRQLLRASFWLHVTYVPPLCAKWTVFLGPSGVVVDLITLSLLSFIKELKCSFFLLVNGIPANHIACSILGSGGGRFHVPSLKLFNFRTQWICGCPLNSPCLSYANFVSGHTLQLWQMIALEVFRINALQKLLLFCAYCFLQLESHIFRFKSFANDNPLARVSCYTRGYLGTFLNSCSVAFMLYKGSIV